MKYYRITDAAILDLSQEFVASLPKLKRDLLRVYEIAPQPTIAADEFLQVGPVTVDEVKAIRAWVVQKKSVEQLAAEKYESDRSADLEQIKLVYQALRNGTGTAAERLTRCERVLARLRLYHAHPRTVGLPPLVGQGLRRTACRSFLPAGCRNKPYTGVSGFPRLTERSDANQAAAPIPARLEKPSGALCL